ncbi:MAG: hypothetical protein RR887_13400 [Niameybacter sp.]
MEEMVVMTVEEIKDISKWADKLAGEYGVGISPIVNSFVKAHAEVKDIEKAKKMIELDLQRATHGDDNR